MKRKQSAVRNQTLNEALATLISSTRTQKRPLPLTKIADSLEVALDKLGSYASVGDRIGLSPQMLRQFSYINRLSRPVQELFEERKLDSVDVAVHLATLSRNDQYPIALALLAREIDTSDVRAITQLRRVEKRAPIKALLRRVKDSKTRKEYVAEFVIRGALKPRRLLAIFKRYIPSDEILRVEEDGVIGRLVLTKAGKAALVGTARKFGTSIHDVIPKLLSESERDGSEI